MMAYAQQTAILEKASPATCDHYCEDYEYLPLDDQCGEVHGTCAECKAEIVRDVLYWPFDSEFVGEWRLA